MQFLVTYSMHVSIICARLHIFLLIMVSYPHDAPRAAISVAAGDIHVVYMYVYIYVYAKHARLNSWTNSYKFTIVDKPAARTYAQHP